MAIRRAVMDDTLAKTGNPTEAAYQGLQVINFGRRGYNPLFRAVTASITFLNARIQGNDVFYRAARGRYSADPRRNKAMIQRTFFLRSMMMMGATSLYYLLVSDTDEYKGTPEVIKDMNWIIPWTVGGVAPHGLRIPIGFEVGLFYKTFPERILDTIMGTSTGADLRETIERGLGSTLELNPFAVQAVMPLIEAGMNHSFFTGRQIVPYYMTKLDEFAQTYPHTAMPAQKLSELLHKGGIDISPIKLDHVMRGYTGTLGSYAIDLADTIIRQLGGPEERRGMKLYQYPILKRFMLGLPTGERQDFYEMHSDLERMVQTYNYLADKGRLDEAYAYYLTRPDLMDNRETINAIAQMLQDFRKSREAIMSSDLDTDVKHQIVDQMDAEIRLLLKGMPEMRKAIGDPWLD